MTAEGDLQRRIERLEAELAIRNLVGRYCFDIDDHDLDAVAGLFTDDAVVRSEDGVMNATGVEAIIQQYRGRFEVLGVSNHMTHDHVIWFDDEDGDLAYGRVSAHAELWRNGAAMVTALRYADRRSDRT